MPKLYKGKVNLSFDEAKHKFNVEIGGKTWTPLSVTKITGVIDKPALLPWGIKLTREYLNEHLPIDTKLTEDDKRSIIETATKQHILVKNEAAGIGTMVHDFAELVAKGKNPKLPDNPEVLNGITAFLKYLDEHQVEFKSAEELIYSLKYDYAGIADAVCMFNGKLALIDYKTSTSVYPEMFLQVSAYRGALIEMGTPIEESYIAHFNKTTGEFAMYKQENFKKDYKAFIAAKTLKDRLNELNKE